MKQVIILYRNNTNMNAIDFIKSDLEEVFAQHISFTNYFLSDLMPDEVLTADAFLVLDEGILQDVTTHVSDFSKIIKINRSPAQEALHQVSEIPANTNVLVVNDSYESSLDTTYSFYDVGISHINMIPYDSSLEHTGIYDAIDTAITPAEPHLVPSHIKNVIDIGYRKVSFDTMFKLMKMLNLDIGLINRNLFLHIHSVVESNTAFHANYVYGFLKSEMLNHVVNTSKIGMVLVDQDFSVVYANDKAFQIFQVEDINSIRFSDYISAEELASEDPMVHPLEIQGYLYYYDKYAIRLMDEIAGYYITLQDESSVELSRKDLQKQGYVAKHVFKDIVHSSDAMEQAIAMAKRIAQTDYTVLIRGESGTGKELMAQSIHNASHRSKFPFIAINCAAIPDNLLESELFGYEAGSFTGARSKGKIGLFEQANHGTLFLDEIGDLSPLLQSRLLRTLQERQVMHIGGNRLIDIDVRFIAATNKDLEQAVKAGTFRDDLFFRLNVFPVVVPPLRQRRDDILPLIHYFLGDSIKNISSDELNLLESYDWPGNIRELENVSTYYRTLLRFPDYIVKYRPSDPVEGGSSPNSSSPNSSSPNGSSPNSRNINIILLKLIEEHSGFSHGIGRNSLQQQLSQQGLILSDRKLRLLLNDLLAQGYITIGKGRLGTSITQAGRHYLHGNA